MRNYCDQTRFEKEVTTEPNKVGEIAPALGDRTKGWDSLKEVPFRGNQNAFSKASARQNSISSSQSNAISKATPNKSSQTATKSNVKSVQQSK